MKCMAWLTVAVTLIDLSLIGIHAQGTGTRKWEEVVRIEFIKNEHVYSLAQAAKGIKIDYQIVVDQDCAGIIPLPPTPVYAKGAGPSGLWPLEKIAGNGHQYCLLDFGLGQPAKETPQTIKKGTYALSFTWDGRSWSGPSDFNNPKGKPFPPGEYVLSVTIHGKVKIDNGTRPYTITKSTKLKLQDVPPGS